MITNIDKFQNLKEQFLVKYLELDKYKFIMQNFETYKNNNMSKEKRFKQVYVDFYGMYHKDKKWHEKYFKVFKELSKKTITSQNYAQEYEELLYKLAKFDTKKHSVEASFASKMLATINPNLPVWDNNVLRSLKTEILAKTDKIIIKDDFQYIIKGKNLKEKITNAKTIYQIIYELENNLLNDSRIKKEINDFKNSFDSEYAKILTNMKVLDLFLWKIGQKKTEIDKIITDN